MIELSEHFVDNWRTRVGGDDPTPAVIQHILQNAVPVARGYALAKCEPFARSLAVYWHPELNLVFKVDDRQGRAVSVYTPDMPKRGRTAPCAIN